MKSIWKWININMCLLISSCCLVDLFSRQARHEEKDKHSQKHQGHHTSGQQVNDHSRLGLRRFTSVLPLASRLQQTHEKVLQEGHEESEEADGEEVVQQGQVGAPREVPVGHETHWDQRQETQTQNDGSAPQRLQIQPKSYPGHDHYHDGRQETVGKEW